MAKFFKITGIVVGVIVLLFVISIVLLVTLVDPNRFKDDLSRYVQKQTGREFAITGDINWSFFPWLGFKVHQMALGNAPGFGQDAFAKVDEADINIKAMPLFRGKVEVGTVTLQGLTMNLMRNAQGQNNWSDLTKSKSAKQPAAPRPASEDQKDAAKAAIGLTINNVQLADAQINWQDLQAGQKAVIDKLNLTSKNMNFGKPFPLTVTFNVKSNKPALNAEVSLNTTATLNTQTQVYTFDKINFDVNMLDNKYPNGKLNLGFNADSIITNLQQQTLAVNNFVAKLANVEMQAQITGSKILDTPLFQGKINVASFNPTTLLAALGNPIKTTDPTALQKAYGSADVQFSPKFVKLNNMHATLDSTNANGRFSMANFSNKTFDFAYKIDQIDLNRYSVKPSTNKPAGTNTAPTTSSNQAVPAAAIPVAALRGLNGSGTLDIGTLKVGKLNATAVSMQLAANNGVIKLSPITANVYMGKSSGGLELDVRTVTPKINVNENLNGIQMESLMNDIAKDSKLQITGIGNMQINLNTQGQTNDQLTRALNGNIKFAVNNGAIKNLNIDQLLASALQYATKAKTGTPNDGSNDTEFSSLTGTVKIANGVASNNDLLLKSSSLQVSGDGTASLIAKTINYHLRAKATGGVFGRDVFNLQDQIGGSFPILISGSFDNPKITPDFSSIAQGLLKGQFRQQVEKHLGIGGADDEDNNLSNTVRGLRNLIGQ